MSRWRAAAGEWLAAAGGLAFAPVAPGTFGTLGGVALAALWGFGAPEQYFFGVLATAAAVVVVGIPIGHWAERHYGRKDPQRYALDEVAGYLLAAAWWSPAAGFPRGFPGWPTLSLAFLLFRIADVLKPPPARRLERLPGGYGIICDDLAAGVWAWLALGALRLSFPQFLFSPA